MPLPWTNLKPEQAELLAATGFLKMVVDGTTTGAPDEPLAANQVVADSLKVVGSSLLGLTVGCAQCHDHKYDPIPRDRLFPPSRGIQPRARHAPLAKADSAAGLALHRHRSSQGRRDRERGIRTAESGGCQDHEIHCGGLRRELGKFAEPKPTTLRKAAINTPAEKRTEEQKKLFAAPNLNINAGVLYQYDQAAADAIKAEQQKVAAERGTKKEVEDFVSVSTSSPESRRKRASFYRGDWRQPKQAVKPGYSRSRRPKNGNGSKCRERPHAGNHRPAPGLRQVPHRWDAPARRPSARQPDLARPLRREDWSRPPATSGPSARPTHPELLDWLAAELPQQDWSLQKTP